MTREEFEKEWKVTESCVYPPYYWINVKDKLPDNMTNVLVWFTGLYNEPKISWYHAKEFHSNMHSDDYLTKWVTHWMPLPEAPK